MHRIGLVLPTAWDRRQLAACEADLREHFEVIELGPDDADVAADFDVHGFLHELAATWRGRLHGVFSSSDYPGAALAAALARELDLPGPGPAAVLGAAHKLHSRQRQRDAVPGAVPRFHAVDPDAPAPWPWSGPAFCKPVKGSFSRHTAVLKDFAALRAHVERPAVARHRQTWLRPFRALQQRFAPELPPPDLFLAEEVLHGQLVTVEGFCAGGGVRTFGVVDSERHAGTGSFLRFDYPSALPRRAQQELERTAAAVAVAHDLQQTFFNVELFWDEVRQRAAVVELNPRMCGQFADLYHKIDGVNSYALALELAAGRSPAVPRRAGAFAAAASVPLRVFAPCRVVQAPDVARVADVEAQAPGLLVLGECRPGDELSDFAGEDGHSVRYAVLNLGGESRPQIGVGVERAAQALGYEFEPLPRC